MARYALLLSAAVATAAAQQCVVITDVPDCSASQVYFDGTYYYGTECSAAYTGTAVIADSWGTFQSCATTCDSDDSCVYFTYDSASTTCKYYDITAQIVEGTLTIGSKYGTDNPCTAASTTTWTTESTSSWTDASTWSVWTTTAADPADEWETWTATTETDPSTTWDTWVEPTTTPVWTAWPTTTRKHHRKVVTVTLTEEYKYPCETGWATETYTILTTWCGCKETPKPEHPEYQTVTTTCPESWGVGETVTLTVPYVTWAPSQTASWGQWSAGSDSTQWSNYGSSSDDSSNQWSNYNTDTSADTSDSSSDTTDSSAWVNYDTSDVESAVYQQYSSVLNAVTWATWNSASSTWVYADTAAETEWSATPVAAVSTTSQCSYTTATVTTICDEWATWDVSKTGSASCVTSTKTDTIYPTTCTGTWAAWTTSTSTPVSDTATQCSYTTTAKVTTICDQWATWDVSKTGTATCVTSTTTETIYPTTCSTGTWAAWSSVAAVSGSKTAWAPVASFTGAAPAKGANAALAIAAGAAAGFAYLL